MKNETYKITYRYLTGAPEVVVGLLDNEHPIDWWERNKEQVAIIEYEPVRVGRNEHGMQFVPHTFGKVRQH